MISAVMGGEVPQANGLGLACKALGLSLARRVLAEARTSSVHIHEG